MQNSNRAKERGRWSAASFVRALCPLLDKSSVGMDLTDRAGSTGLRVKQLHYANVQRRAPNRRVRLQGYLAVLETLQKEYKEACPILLCWRVRQADRQGALAPDPVRDYSPRRGGTGHRAMVAKWNVTRLQLGRVNHPEQRSIRGQVLLKNWT